MYKFTEYAFPGERLRKLFKESFRLYVDIKSHEFCYSK